MMDNPSLGSDINTIPELFRWRVQHSPHAPAYHDYDNAQQQWRSINWQSMAACVDRWQLAMQSEDLRPGDRVAIMLSNNPYWVMFDQAALALGLVVVPLYISDHAENIAYILQHSGSKLLLLNGSEQWQRLQSMRPQLNGLLRVLSIKPLQDQRSSNLLHVESWLCRGRGELHHFSAQANTLASIVYTSGTTGHPKGVMLSHYNMLHNAASGIQHIQVYRDDVFLSFLPLSHTLERTIGYYLPMMAGAQVAYARSIAQLGDDMRQIRPTIIISVPRIFERIREKTLAKVSLAAPWKQSLFAYAQDVGWRNFEYHQQRACWHYSLLFHPLLKWLVHRPLLQAMGGRMRFAISGGAALQKEVAQFFLAAGLALQQGYGLTEHSPVASVNSLQNNDPQSVGTLLAGVQAQLTEQGELLLRSPCVMQGYWNNHQATASCIDEDGWLHTGDIACFNGDHLYISGRLKDIIVLSNGEKICPLDLEAMLTLEPFIEQALVVGEGRAYLAALLVINNEAIIDWQNRHPEVKKANILHDGAFIAWMLKKAQQATREFPGYAKIRRIHLLNQAWNVEQGTLTATLKQRRQIIIQQYRECIEALYQPTQTSQSKESSRSKSRHPF